MLDADRTRADQLQGADIQTARVRSQVCQLDILSSLLHSVHTAATCGVWDHTM